jgi:DnaJ-class molecular chaperone
MDKNEVIKRKLIELFFEENRTGQTEWHMDHILVNIDEAFETVEENICHLCKGKGVFGTDKISCPRCNGYRL